MTVRYLRSIKQVQGMYPAPAIIEPPKINYDVIRHYQRITQTSHLLAQTVQNSPKEDKTEIEISDSDSSSSSTSRNNEIFRPYQL